MVQGLSFVREFGINNPLFEIKKCIILYFK